MSATQEASTVDPISGIVTLIAAMGDLNRMWEEAAEVAPEDIQTDVEAVRDAWAQQLETAEKMASDPLGGLASSLMTGITSAGSMQRVDTYTAENCPEVGAMFFAAESTSPQDTPTSTASPDPNPKSSPTPTPDTYLQPGTGWLPFGSFLASSLTIDREHELAKRAATLFIPEVGVVEVNASAFLNGADVFAEQYLYFSEGDEPHLAGLITTREPSSGLEPEGYRMSVVVLDLSSGTARIAERMDGEKVSVQPAVSLAGTAGDSIVVVQTETAEDVELVAYDLTEKEVAWQKSGMSITRPGEVGFGWITDPGEAAPDECVAYVNGYGLDGHEVTYHWTDLETGSPSFSMPLMVGGEDNDTCRIIGESLLSPRFSTVERYSMTEYATAGFFVLDRQTEDTPQVPGPIELTDPIGTAGLVAHGSERVSDTEPADLIVVDLATGDEWFRIEEERAEALDIQPVALFDGVLYLTTTDERVAVDVTSGEEMGSWSIYPVGQVGAYTYISDGTLRDDIEFEGLKDH
ncbi:hypothetical protein GCM10023190_06460 [Enteractinococcus fodinae]